MRHLTRAIAAALLLAPFAAMGDDNLDLDIEVIARRLNEARSSIQPSLGATTYRFDRQQLDGVAQGADAPLNQVLLRAPGVAEDSFGQVHIRNEHANVQYRLDGVQLPEGLAVFGQVLESRFARSMTLITGALPAQYGFRQAGVVDITTKSGITDPGGEITMTLGSHGILQPSISYGGRSGPIDYFFSGDLLQTGMGIENPTSTPDAIHDRSVQQHGLLHVSGIVDATTRISLTAGVARGSYQIPNSPGQTTAFTVNGNSAFNSAQLNERQRESTTFAVLSLQKQFDNGDLQLSVFNRNSQLSFTPDPLGDLMFNGIAQTARRSSLATGVQADSSWRVDERHTVRLGLLAQVERVTANTSSLVLPVDAAGAQTLPDTPYTVAGANARTGGLYGVYAQDEWRLTPTLTLNWGLRFDAVDQYTSETQLSPRLNLVWQATKQTTLHAGYARYFTPPPFELVGSNAIAAFAGSTAAPEVTQNDKVRAEWAHYFDVGISHKLLPELTVGLDGYFKISQNLLDEGQFGAPIVLAPFNYRSGQQHGVEATADWQSGPWTAYLNVAWSRGVGRQIDSAQFNFGAAELAYIAQHWIYLDHDQRWTGSAGATYALFASTDHPARLSADVLVQSGLRASTASVPNGAALPSYAVLNLAAVQDFALGVGRGTSLRLDVVNVLDAKYQIRNGTGVGVGAPQYGLRRTVLATLSQRF